MRVGLTKRQLDAYTFICSYLDEHGYAPSLVEISEGLGYSEQTKQCALRLLQGLEEREYIRRIARRARAIEVIGPPLMAKVQPPSVFTFKGERFLGFKVARAA